MKPHKFIDYHCRLHGITMPEIEWSETRFFVTISAGGAKVLYMREPSQLLGRIVGHAMKTGKVLFVHNGWVKEISWDNWKQIWDKIFVPKKRNTLPEPNRISPYKSEIFEIMRQKRGHKKPRKRGFERTESANKSMNLLGHPLAGIHVEAI